MDIERLLGEGYSFAGIAGYFVDLGLHMPVTTLKNYDTLKHRAPTRFDLQNADPARGRPLPKPTKGLGAEHLKFNLHAGVSVPGGLPAARERLIRYCARPPLALERLSVLEDSRICYRIKDTDQVRLMTPMQFMARLAALVPPPRHP